MRVGWFAIAQSLANCIPAATGRRNTDRRRDKITALFDEIEPRQLGEVSSVPTALQVDIAVFLVNALVRGVSRARACGARNRIAKAL